MEENKDYLSRVIKNAKLEGTKDEVEVVLEFEGGTSQTILIRMGDKISKKQRHITTTKLLDRLKGKVLVSINKDKIEDCSAFKYGGFEVCLMARNKKSGVATKYQIVSAAYTSKKIKKHDTEEIFEG